MSIFEAIINHFNAHLDATSRSIESLVPHLAEASNLLSQSLIDEKKILCISAASSFAAGQQFCHNMLGSIELERPALPAIFLDNSNTATACLSSSDISNIHAQQIQALGQQGDILLLFSANGEEPALLKAIDAALQRGMIVISIGAGEGAAIGNNTPKTHVHIPLLGVSKLQATNIHFLLAQVLSDLVEQQLFGSLAS